MTRRSTSLKSEAKVASSSSRHPAHQPHQVRKHITTSRPSKSTAQTKSRCASTRGGQRPNQQTSTNDALTIQVHCQAQATKAVHQQVKRSPTQLGVYCTKGGQKRYSSSNKCITKKSKHKSAQNQKQTTLIKEVFVDDERSVAATRHDCA